MPCVLLSRPPLTRIELLLLALTLQAAGSSGSGSPHDAAPLDQFAPMLPSDPVQQLPLLPTAACTSATQRVAAWLLASADCGGGGDVAADADGACRQQLGAAHATEAEAHLMELATEAAQQAQPQLLGAGKVGGGRRAASAALYCSESHSKRSSLDGFMSQPVQVGAVWAGGGVAGG